LFISIDSFLFLLLLIGGASWSSGLPFERYRVQIPTRAEIWFDISASPAPPAHSAMMSTHDCTLPLARWDSEEEE